MKRTSLGGIRGSAFSTNMLLSTAQLGTADSGTRDLPPLPETKIVGRSREIAYIVSTVKERSTQLLTILGPGGVGKTRLVLTAAWNLAPLFADGVVFMPFTTTDREQVWQLIMHKLEIPHQADLPRFDAVRNALQSKQLLLILDNCEKITEIFSGLPNLLAHCPGVMVVATSQEPLRVRGEQEFWLQPLALPRKETRITMDTVEKSSAVELFMMRTRRRDSTFELNDDNAADIAAIVRMLDGLPLAIELAAAQMRHLSPAALRQRLERALPSLSGGSQDLPERQRSLLGMMEWSLSLLNEEDRDRFLQLAVLSGDFTPETAAMIVGVSPVDGWELLISFADKSLIKQVVTTGETSTRFFMLETVQTVALHLLKQRPELYAEASVRHAEAYLACAREAAEHWHSSDQLEWYQRMEQEHPNVELAIERALGEPRLVRVALELAEPMFWYWYSRGWHGWALRRIEQLLNSAPDDLPPHIRGSAHVTAGWLAFKQTQVVRAEHHFRMGLQLFPDKASPAALRGAIGAAYVLFFEGNNGIQALEELRQVIRRARSNPAAWHELAAGYFGMGLTRYFMTETVPAREDFEASLRISRAHDDRQSTAMNLLYLAHIDRVEGKPRAAIRKLQEVVPLFLDLAGESNILLSLDVVVSLLADLGELGMARRIASASEHTRRTLSMPRSPLEQGDFDEAMDRIRAGLDVEEYEAIDDARDARPLREAVEEFLQYRPASPSQPDDKSPVAAVLSPRELEVLRMVADGKTASEIAKILFVSPHTVKRHMANVRVKLGVRTQAAAVAALQRVR